MVSVAAWHTVWGWARWLSLTPKQVTEAESQRNITKKRRWYGINAVSVVVAGLWLAGSLGVVGRGGKTDGWVGREYDELYKSIPLIGKLNQF